jgi:hypothetical protein
MSIHSCSYYCNRPECIKAQRDELVKRMETDENGCKRLERSLYTRLQQLNSELLKALKALVLSAERVSVGEYDEETLDINLSQARAAIVKATGENT